MEQKEVDKNIKKIKAYLKKKGLYIEYAAITENPYAFSIIICGKPKAFSDKEMEKWWKDKQKE